MRKIIALVRARWLTALTYRLDLLLSLVGLVLTIVPAYFVAGALQPIVEDSIRTEGGHYFAFLILGFIALSFVEVSVESLPDELQAGISKGTWEALLTTPTRLPQLLLGLIGYQVSWTGLRSVLMLAGAGMLGAGIAWERSVIGLLVLVLVILSYLPFGLIAASLLLAFRTTGPLTQGVVFASEFLGGVYYSTDVIPSWVQHFSALVPLTYGLRALRRSLLGEFSLSAILLDVAILSLFVVGLTVISGIIFLSALRYARRCGTLAQY